MKPESKFAQRLPDTFYPNHYELSIVPDINHEYFTGKVVITVNVRKPTDVMVINGAELSLTEVSVVNNGKVIRPVKIDQILKDNHNIFTFDSVLSVGISEVQINFRKNLSSNMMGFYRTSYLDDENKLHECLATAFPPDAASRAFPCFDEPAFKATFKLSIKYSRNKTVISNSALEKIEDIDKNIANYHFKTTPKMSTYLLVWVIGDFGSISKTGSSGITYTCYAPINQVHQTEYSLNACDEFVNFYQEFFGIKYPLEKLDLVSVPDIAFGAIENWGLITFKEDFFLVDPVKTSNSTKRFVSMVVAHETSHQWFGNLVTMGWWTDVWLNEGFANWIQNLAVDKVFPGVKIWNTHFISEYCTALESDSYFHSHPIEIEATHPSDLDEIFDHITYCKGSSVINMMSAFVGLDSLRAGLHDYMLKYQYSNVSTQNLWDCLENVSKKPVSKLMKTFTRQTGYPVVHVIIEPATGPLTSSRVLKITQARFLLDSTNQVPKQLWLIPICVSCVYEKKKIEHEMVLELECDEMHIVEGPDLKYILVNQKRTGFFSTLYSEPLYTLLISHLSELLIEDRIGLLSDYYSFARSGLVGTDEFLDLVVKFSEIGEKEEQVWHVITTSLTEIHCLMFCSSDFENFNKNFGDFCVKIMKPIMDYYKIAPDVSKHDESVVILLSYIISILLHFDQGLKNKLLFWFDEYVSGRLNLLPDLRICAFRACYTSETYFQKLMAYFRTVKMTEEKVDIIDASSSATETHIISQLYDFSLSPDVRPQDSRGIYISLENCPYSHEIGWEFVKTNYKRICDFFSVSFIITKVLCSSVSGFASMDKYNECKDYFDSRQSIDLNQPIYQALEQIKIKSSWFARDERRILNWFERSAK